MLNSFVIQGRLTNSVNAKTSQSGKVYAFLKLACKRETKDHTTDFLDVLLFGDFCTTLEKYANKGTELIVSGIVQSRTFEEDGKKVKRISLVCKKIYFVGGNKEYKKEDEDVECSDDSELPF